LGWEGNPPERQEGGKQQVGKRTRNAAQRKGPVLNNGVEVAGKEGRGLEGGRHNNPSAVRLTVGNSQELAVLCIRSRSKGGSSDKDHLARIPEGGERGPRHHQDPRLGCSTLEGGEVATNWKGNSAIRNSSRKNNRSGYRTSLEQRGVSNPTATEEKWQRQ